MLALSAALGDGDGRSRHLARAAKLLIDRHGDTAAITAAITAAARRGELEAAGDKVGAAKWAQIHRAIVEMQAPPAAGEKLN